MVDRDSSRTGTRKPGDERRLTGKQSEMVCDGDSSKMRKHAEERSMQRRRVKMVCGALRQQEKSRKKKTDVETERVGVQWTKAATEGQKKALKKENQQGNRE